MRAKAGIYLLIGIFLLSIAIFRQDWLWELGEAGAWIYNGCISTGIVLIGYSAGKLMKIRPLFVLGGLIGFELLIGLIIGFIVIAQPAKVPYMRFFQNLYALCYNTLQYDSDISEYNPVFGYLFKKNTKSSFSQWEFSPKSISTNFLGLRDDSASCIDPDIIVLGDSFTAGWGVGQEELFTVLLEKQLGRKVLNAGISSFGTVRENLLLRHLPRDSCRLVIIQYCANDFEENKAWSDSASAFRSSMNAQMYSNRQIQNKAGRMYVPFKLLFYTSLKVFQYLFVSPEKHDIFYKSKPGEPLEHTDYFLKTVQDVRSYYHGNVLVVSLSNSKRFDTQFMLNTEQSAREKEWKNIFFLNISPIFVQGDNYTIDGHNTASGHRKIAEQLSKFIKNNDL
ncbi:SGNH/GDSL hydrolase family protein [Runella sp.]|uniref:SGNH/GDSL hydrolase family protein n=1 Tax=Runella sp. TaxID=1960881 RepID=UPI003D0EA3E5